MRIAIVLLLCHEAFAAGVQITDTIKTPFSGTLFTGKITISGPKMATAAGDTVAQWQNDYQVTNGAFSVTLEANDTATPAGTSYSVRYTPAPAQRGSAWTETWIVPTSQYPLKIKDVRVQTTPTPGLSIQPSQIASGGATSGQCLAWSGSSYQPTNCGTAGVVGYSTTFTVTTYSAGTVAVTSGDTAVIGTGTAWDGSMVGSYLSTRGTAYLIASVQSPTQLTLAGSYTHETEVGGVSYYISQPVVVAGTTHRLGGPGLTVRLYRDDTTALVDNEPEILWIDPTTFDVKALFATNMTGRIVILH